MAIDLIAADDQEYDSNNTLATPTTGLAYTKPTNLADDDLAFIFGGTNGLVDLSTYPSSWVEVLDYQPAVQNSRYRIHVGYKVISSAAGEPATYTFTYTPDSTGRDASSIMSRVEGVNTSSPLDVTWSAASHGNVGSSGAPSIKAITTATDGAMAIAVVAFDAAQGPVSANPSGWTLENEITTGNNGVALAVYSQIKAVAGTIGAEVLAITGSSWWSTAVFALKPDAVPLSFEMTAPSLTVTPGEPVVGEHSPVVLSLTPGVLSVDVPAGIFLTFDQQQVTVTGGTATFALGPKVTATGPSLSVTPGTATFSLPAPASTYWYTPPTETTYHRIIGSMTLSITEGRSVLITGGVATLHVEPTMAEIEAADTYLGGGRRHLITADDRTAIENAGLGGTFEEV